MSKEITLQEAALAWAQGKRVEAKHPARDGWGIITPVGSDNGAYSGKVFSCADWLFRVASEPPAKRFRPWTPEEVPVGAQVRYKGNSKSIRMLIVCDREPDLLGISSHWKLQDLLASMEHSIDNGKTWSVCGVEVSE